MVEEPVRIGLVFARSGQQVFVNVPRHWAESAQSRAQANYCLLAAQREKSSCASLNDDKGCQH